MRICARALVALSYTERHISVRAICGERILTSLAPHSLSFVSVLNGCTHFRKAYASRNARSDTPTKKYHTPSSGSRIASETLWRACGAWTLYKLRGRNQRPHHTFTTAVASADAADTTTTTGESFTYPVCARTCALRPITQHAHHTEKRRGLQSLCTG